MYLPRLSHTLDGYAAFPFDGRPQSRIVSFAWEKGNDRRDRSREPNLLPFAAGARRQSATTISSFVVGLVAFVSAAPANVFWSAFRFHQFAAGSRQN